MTRFPVLGDSGHCLPRNGIPGFQRLRGLTVAPSGTWDLLNQEEVGGEGGPADPELQAAGGLPSGVG